MICEQLLREREVTIREEYDKVLASKLAEQYDCFVRFTTDQIQQRLSQAALPSCEYYEYISFVILAVCISTSTFYCLCMLLSKCFGLKSLAVTNKWRKEFSI